MKRPQLGFALRLAAREARHGLKRIGLYMCSIAIGIGALVAIQTFREGVVATVLDQSRRTMGADVRLTTASGPFGTGVAAVLDSLVATGASVARVSMATGMISADGQDARMAQVVAATGGYPFYGEPVGDPDPWTGEVGDDEVFVSPGAAAAINVRSGDTLQVGPLRLVVRGVVEGIPGPTPGNLIIGAVFGPPVYVSPAALQRSGLLGAGTIATYEAFLVMEDEDERSAFREAREALWDEEGVSVGFADEEAEAMAEAVSVATRFLSFVGVAALLLGGLGVASAIHIYMIEKRSSVAVLRCLGAGRWTAFGAYLIQAAGLGLGGALLGGLFGTLMQAAFPLLVSGLLPVEISPRFSGAAWLAGLGIGVWIAVTFALIPLLKIRRVSPLETLRSDYEPPADKEPDGAVQTAYLVVILSALALCIIEAPHYALGFAFAAALAVAVGCLALSAWGTVSLTRRFLPGRLPYAVRQGVSNLFRPRNQTLSLTIALGSGAFVIGMVVVMSGSLNRAMNAVTEGSGMSPTVVFFNVDGEARDGILEIVSAELENEPGAENSPEDGESTVDANRTIESWSLTSGSVVEINWRLVEDLVADSSSGIDSSAARARYGATVRPHLQEWETVTEGEWWDDSEDGDPGLGTDASPLLASVAEGPARSLGIVVGDTVVWEMEGRFVTTVVANLREVNRSEAPPLGEALGQRNAVVLKPSASAVLPISYVVGAVFDDPSANARVQTAVRRSHPEVSAYDLYRIVELGVAFLGRLKQGITLLAVFSILVGLVVLVGVIATSRVQRFREGALLRTLGADRRNILTVLLSEFLTVGTMATFAGLLLGAVLAIPFVVVGVDIAHAPQALELAGIWIGLMGATAAVGLLSSRGLLSKPPLATLRGE